MDVHIIDDDVFLQEIYIAFAEEMNLTTMSFLSAENYLDYVDDDNYCTPELVILTDLEMPGISGDELIYKIRKTKPEQKFILATGNPQNVNHTEDKSCFYLTKPVSMERLQSVFKALSQCTKYGPDAFCTNFDCASLSDLSDFPISKFVCPHKRK